MKKGGRKKAGDKIFIRYKLKFELGGKKEFNIDLDYDSLDILAEKSSDPPDWTRLEFHQCPNCPLEKAKHPHCPVAVHLTDVIDFLIDLTSWQEVDVEVVTGQRSYCAHTTLQTVAGSLMGIYMTTSGCPILNKMRPMVETHLPFASWQETVYRVVSMYVLSQYFRMKAGKKPKWDLQGLVDYYEEVQRINVAFNDRLNNIPLREGDASLNAISILSSYASMAAMKIQDDDLEHWKNIFMETWGRD
jgi:hypothetical protein